MYMKKLFVRDKSYYVGIFSINIFDDIKLRLIHTLNIKVHTNYYFLWLLMQGFVNFSRSLVITIHIILESSAGIREFRLVCKKLAFIYLLSPLIHWSRDLPNQFVFDIVVHCICIGKSVIAKAVPEEWVGRLFKYCWYSRWASAFNCGHQASLSSMADGIDVQVQLFRFLSEQGKSSLVTAHTSVVHHSVAEWIYDWQIRSHAKNLVQHRRWAMLCHDMCDGRVSRSD